jgi:hypothetical protein
MAEQSLHVGSLAAARGQKIHGTCDFSVDGLPYRLPMWLVNGAADGPTLVVTAGVHPAEYASIAAALELGRSADPALLRGRIIVVPVVNLPAFTARSIYVCPLDGKNLNRVFPGSAAGTASEQIAAWVFANVISQADYYVDMHGGDLIEALVPFTIFFRSGAAQVDQASLRLAAAFGIPLLVSSETPGSTVSAAGRAGIPAILTEAGGQGIWTRDDVAWHVNGLRRVMREFGMLAGGAPDPVDCRVLSKFLWLRSDHDGFWYPGVTVGAEVARGQDLGHVTDWEGREIQAAPSPADGQVLFIVSSLAINKGDPLLAVGA